MATMAEIKAKVNDLETTQRYEKTFDLVRSFVARANTADSFAIPLTMEGPFVQEAYNVRYTRNSKRTPAGGSAENFCGVKLKMKSQAEGASQSNDYVPVQLVATPGADDMPRYGARPFFHFYPKGDVLIIDYDNRAPQSLNGETYEMADEKIDICFTGKIYPINMD